MIFYLYLNKIFATDSTYQYVCDIAFPFREFRDRREKVPHIPTRLSE